MSNVPWFIWGAIVSALGWANTLAAQDSAARKRPITVADIIELTTIGSAPSPTAYGPPLEDVDVRSPDGTVSAMVVHKGNVARNTNDYLLLVFRTAELVHNARPDTVLQWSSSSTRSAISALSWLADNRTLAFLGEQPGALPQVYTVRVDTKQVTVRTAEQTAIVRYGISADGSRLVLTVEQPRDTSDYPARRRDGFAVRPTDWPADLVAGDWNQHVPVGGWPPMEIVVVRPGSPPRRLTNPIPGTEACRGVPQVSPDGHYAIVPCLATGERPIWWFDYKVRGGDPQLQDSAKAAFAQFVLLDLERDTARPLIGTPAEDRWLLVPWTVAWIPGRGSVVVSGVRLPLTVSDSTERLRRHTSVAVAEIDLTTGATIAIAYDTTTSHPDVVRWRGKEGVLEVARTHYDRETSDPLVVERAWYRPVSRGPWRRGRVPALDRAPMPPLTLERRGPDAPARLVARDAASGRRTVVFDPAPELAPFRLAPVRVVNGRLRDSTTWSGGLYLPPDTTPGARYPLVIQTHGFSDRVFEPQGYASTANAAQPLAAHGIAVLQMADAEGPAPREGPVAMAGYEDAVRLLDSLGLIDPARVGIEGWSRTCYSVLYTLVHSTQPFAAAIVSDGVDGSYFQQVLHQNVIGLRYDPFYGAAPVGGGLAAWADQAPGFNLDKVSTPLRLEAASGRTSILNEWEPYSWLVALGKPVELIVYPDATHVLVTPSQRLASQEGALDWFRFWLKDEEEPVPGRRARYARWHVLRKLHQRQTPSDTAEHKSK